MILILANLISCSEKSETNLAPFFRFLLKSAGQVTITGKVSGPSTVKNAVVSLIPLPSNGGCITPDGKLNGTILATARTNERGECTLTYQSTGTAPCLVITGDDSTTMQISYGSKKSIPWQGNHLFTIFQEPKNFKRDSNGQLLASKRVNANPFTRIASSRFLASRTTQNFSKNQSLWSKLHSLKSSFKTEEELLADA